MGKDGPHDGTLGIRLTLARSTCRLETRVQLLGSTFGGHQIIKAKCFASSISAINNRRFGVPRFGLSQKAAVDKVRPEPSVCTAPVIYICRI